jgi:hypothetical protein
MRQNAWFRLVRALQMHRRMIQMDEQIRSQRGGAIALITVGIVIALFTLVAWFLATAAAGLGQLACDGSRCDDMADASRNGLNTMLTVGLLGSAGFVIGGAVWLGRLPKPARR